MTARLALTLMCGSRGQRPAGTDHEEKPDAGTDAKRPPAERPDHDLDPVDR